MHPSLYPGYPYQESRARTSAGCPSAARIPFVRIIIMMVFASPLLPLAALWLQHVRPLTGSVVRMSGIPRPLEWERSGDGVLLHVPAEISAHPPCPFAWSFTIERPEP